MPDPTIAYLRSPQAIRERCGQLFELACAGQLHYFCCNLDRLPAVADYVLQVTRQHYPDLNVPFHSRWRHFEVGSLPRLALLESQLAELSPIAKAKAKFDLAIVSVLLDAGAGDQWQYRESETGEVFRRSEGLAVASFQMFQQGLFSSDANQPLQIDAIGLQHITEATLSQGFQVSATNPLVGLTGRTELLQKLGQVLTQHPTLFSSPTLRPGDLVDYLLTQTHNHELPASTVLAAILEGFSDIWPGRITLAGVNLGDVWQHSALSSTPPNSLIPFHKLSQWLTYSLLEPLQELGITITGLDDLTGLPEYRNGGLCLDLGLLQLPDRSLLQQAHLPGSELIVEWRALTVILLDRIADTLRQTLSMTTTDLPLVKVLQGGTWTAGRQIAAELRPSHGLPPIQIQSDGTVF
jgi:hypothetical protein